MYWWGIPPSKTIAVFSKKVAQRQYIEKNADDKPYWSLRTDSSPPERLTSQNTQCYQCLTPYYASLVCLYCGGQF